VQSAAQFIDNLASHGQYHFSLEEVAGSIGGSPTAVRAALRRLKKKTLLAEPARGFLVIVPPEYRLQECLPAEQFIPDLMAHWDETYYVALLSAAEIHGAAHQRPQVFQVMLGNSRRGIACGRIRIEFAARHDMNRTPVVERNTARGVLRIASPEATAFELVGYVDRCGGLDNVSTVLAELGESLSSERLIAEGERCPVAWTQRLGYLLDLVGREELAAPLQSFVTDVEESTPLVRSTARSGSPRNRRWKLAINAQVEPDL